jgi:Flp pilus assembly protein TadG
MMMNGLGLVCLMLVAGSVEAAARCSVPRISTFDNETVNGQMTVNSGAQCRIVLKHSRGPTYSAHIVERPSHGTVTVASGNRIVYRSRSGYVGRDSFTYARRGETHAGVPTTRTVRISVNVTE